MGRPSAAIISVKSNGSRFERRETRLSVSPPCPSDSRHVPWLLPGQLYNEEAATLDFSLSLHFNQGSAVLMRESNQPIRRGTWNSLCGPQVTSGPRKTDGQDARNHTVTLSFPPMRPPRPQMATGSPLHPALPHFCGKRCVRGPNRLRLIEFKVELCLSGLRRPPAQSPSLAGDRAWVAADTAGPRRTGHLFADVPCPCEPALRVC